MNLTWRSYIIAVTIAVMGIASEWHSEISSSVWRVFTAAAVIILFLEFALLKKHRIVISRVLPAIAHLGRKTNAKLIIENVSHYRLDLHIFDLHPNAVAEGNSVFSVKLQRHSKKSIPFTITPVRLQSLVWKSVQIQILGRYGFARWTQKISVNNELSVVPDRLYSNELRKTLTQPQGALSRQNPGTGNELLGMREYQTGDPLHTIDWKATARSQRTIVRLFSEEQRLDLVILIDAGRASGMRAGALTRLGHYTNIAARLAEKAISSGDTLGIIIFADDVLNASKQLKGQFGLQRLRAILGSVKTVNIESNPIIAVMEVKKIVRHRSLVVVLTDLDDNDAASQLIKSIGILRQRHLPLIASILDDETISIGQGLTQNWISPYNTLAAVEIQNSWYRTKAKIERLGVPVVLSKVDNIDGKVLSRYGMLKNQHKV